MCYCPLSSIFKQHKLYKEHYKASKHRLKNAKLVMPFGAHKLSWNSHSASQHWCFDVGLKQCRFKVSSLNSRNMCKYENITLWKQKLCQNSYLSFVWRWDWNSCFYC